MQKPFYKEYKQKIFKFVWKMAELESYESIIKGLPQPQIVFQQGMVL